MIKKRRVISLFKNRILSLFLATVMFLTSIFTSLNFIRIILPAVAEEAAEDVTIRDDALHFFIRHWHTAEDAEAMLQGGQEDDNGNFFVVVEGYILPNENTGTYTFYLIDQDTKEPVTNVTDSPYVDDVDSAVGSITLNTKLLKDTNSNDLERFSGFSISAGHSAVDYLEENGGIKNYL